MVTIMPPERLKASLKIPDLTDPKNGKHAINVIIKKIENNLKRVYLEYIFEEVRTDPRVTVKENFDDLLFPANNVGRSSRYTRYITEDIILRTHTSAAIPRLLKKLIDNNIKNAIAVLPGMCYRRDVVDKTHCGEPHQMDVWIIKDNNPKFGRGDLIQLIETILNSTVPDFEYRANEVQHPYTLNGLEIEILVNGEWLELLECGEAHPTVLKNSGLDPEKFSGLALGMGLDRLIMLIKKIDDIRILRSQDPRIKNQMENLNPYVAVSKYPPIRQDLSVSVTEDTTEEDICEKISDAMGDNSNVIEEIVIISETPYEKLPEKAIERLGIEPGQKNMLVKVILRSHERSLIHEEANDMRDIIYRSIDESKTGGYLTYRE